MGLAASQARYLALTSRKSDLEYQSQTINTRRIQLSYKTAEIAEAYAEGMSNQKIKVSQLKTNTTTGKTETNWNELTFSNLLSEGYMLIGTSGAGLDPAPYIKENDAYNYTTTDTSTINATEYSALSAEDKCAYEEVTSSSDAESSDAESSDAESNSETAITYKLKSPISEAVKSALSDSLQAKYTQGEKVGSNYIVNPEYSKSENAMDIQSMLVSGTGHIVSKAFFDYLVENGYDYSTGLDAETYSDLLNDWTANNGGINPTSTPSVIDWRSDTSDTFQQKSYTEDDEEVLAKYEADTAKIQAQDKILEVQEKNIETQHKAIETELESIQKVIQNNIEKTFKIFT